MAKTTPFARIGDIGVGVCCCHDDCVGMAGVIVTGKEKVTVCNSQSAHVGSIVIGACGHPGIIVTGDEKVTVQNDQQSQVTDLFVGCFSGTIVTGCEKVT